MGLLFLRWMLQRVLSYPCFLLDETWLASRLTVTPASVREALPGGLGDGLLGPAEYRGILVDFRGKRWWRMGVEYILWDLAGKTSLGVDQLRRSLDRESRPPVEPERDIAPCSVPRQRFPAIRPISTIPAKRSESCRTTGHRLPEQAWVTIELAPSAISVLTGS